MQHMDRWAEFRRRREANIRKYVEARKTVQRRERFRQILIMRRVLKEQYGIYEVIIRNHR